MIFSPRKTETPKIPTSYVTSNHLGQTVVINDQGESRALTTGRAEAGPDLPAQASVSDALPKDAVSCGCGPLPDYSVDDRFDLGGLLFDDEALQRKLVRLLLPYAGGTRILVSCWEREKNNEVGKVVGQGDSYATCGMAFLLSSLCMASRIRGWEKKVEAPSIQCGRTDAQSGRDPWGKCNVICVGGNLSNPSTHTLMQQAELALPLVFDRHDIVLTTDPDRRYAPPEEPVTDRLSPEYDYALVVRVPNVFARDPNEKRVAWILAGANTYGSFAAADFFSKADHINWLADRVGDHAFQLVVKGTWQDRENTWPNQAIPEMLQVRSAPGQPWQEMPI